MPSASPVVLITGAAGGIGRAAVRRFSEARFAVLAVDIDPSVTRLDRPAGGGPILGVVADHENLDSVQWATSRAQDLGTLSHAVLLAGVALPDEIEHDDREGLLHPDLFRRSLERNLMGHVSVLWSIQDRLFHASGDRSVTLCSSVNAIQSWGEPGYSTAKAGLIGLVRSLAGPFGARGVRVNALMPGTIDTSGARAEYDADPERFERMRRTIPLGSLGADVDVAEAALCLARDLRHVHGAILNVDGGQSVLGAM